jgi:hypothetical protein
MPLDLMKMCSYYDVVKFKYVCDISAQELSKSPLSDMSCVKLEAS